MKHRILIEFESDRLPDDFTDQVAGRVYGMPCVNKVECTATLVGDVLKDNRAYHYSMQLDSPAEHGIEYQWQQGTYEERNQGIDASIYVAINAEKESE